MGEIKKSKTRVVLIVLGIILLALASFYFVNHKIKVKNSKFITIQRPNNYYLSYQEEFNAVKLYDENFNLVETRSVKSGGFYFDNFETDDKYYLVGETNLISIDKKTKKVKEVENGFLEGTSFYVEEYDGDLIFLDQSTEEFDNDYEYKVHDVGNFNGDEIKTFKGTKPIINTLVKANDKYYSISSDNLMDTYGELNKQYIEVFDNEGNFLHSKEIENPNDTYEFFKSGNNVYVIANYNPSSLFKFDLEKEEIVKEPIMRVEEAVFRYEGEALYLSKRNEIMKVNLENLQLEKVFNSTDYYANKEDTEVFFFATKNAQLVILNKKAENDMMDIEGLYIRSKGEKEFRKAEGAAIIRGLPGSIFIGDLN